MTSPQYIEPLLTRISNGYTIDDDARVVGALLDTLRVIVSEHASQTSPVHLTEQLALLAQHAIRQAERRPLQ